MPVSITNRENVKEAAGKFDAAYALKLNNESPGSADAYCTKHGMKLVRKGSEVQVVKETKVTKNELEAKLAKDNSEMGTDFSLGNTYGNYELWCNGSRLEAGSVQDCYQAWIKYRFDRKSKKRGSVKEQKMSTDKSAHKCPDCGQQMEVLPAGNISGMEGKWRAYCPNQKCNYDEYYFEPLKESGTYSRLGTEEILADKVKEVEGLGGVVTRDDEAGTVIATTPDGEEIFLAIRKGAKGQLWLMMYNPEFYPRPEDTHHEGGLGDTLPESAKQLLDKKDMSVEDALKWARAHGGADTKKQVAALAGLRNSGMSVPKDIATINTAIMKLGGETNESTMHLPSNIKDWLKQVGGTYMTQQARKAANWSQRCGKYVQGGRTIGKSPQTLILDLSHQGSEIYIYPDGDKYSGMEVRSKKVTNFEEFKAALEDTPNAADLDDNPGDAGGGGGPKRHGTERRMREAFHPPTKEEVAELAEVGLTDPAWDGVFSEGPDTCIVVKGTKDGKTVWGIWPTDCNAADIVWKDRREALPEARYAGEQDPVPGEKWRHKSATNTVVTVKKLTSKGGERRVDYVDVGKETNPKAVRSMELEVFIKNFLPEDADRPVDPDPGEFRQWHEQGKFDKDYHANDARNMVAGLGLKESTPAPPEGKEVIPLGDTKIMTWFERDRQHVALVDKETEQVTYVEWWDDDVTDMVESGYLDPKDYHGSAYDYAVEHGLNSIYRDKTVEPDIEEGHALAGDKSTPGLYQVDYEPGTLGSQTYKTYAKDSQDAVNKFNAWFVNQRHFSTNVKIGDVTKIGPAFGHTKQEQELLTGESIKVMETVLGKK